MLMSETPGGVVEDFSGDLVAKTEFPMRGTWVQSLLRELDPEY